MCTRTVGAVIAIAWTVQGLVGEPVAAQTAAGPGAANWRASPETTVTPTANGAEQRVASRTVSASASGVLPNKHGQIWREYDIRPYTSRVTSTSKPEQAVVDWILRETGTKIRFSEPLGILSASRDTLRVYHTPEMQRLVAEIVDRFVATKAESHVLAMRLVTISSPNWRNKAHPLLRPVEVQTPGVEAWLVSKENTAILLAELAKRTDYREQSSPNLLLHNGQSHTVSRMRPRNYVRTVRIRQDVWPGHELQMGQVEEGYSLQISPLLSRDAAAVDAVIKCHIDQVERLVPVMIDVPALNGQTQRVEVQVPQIVSWRLLERFRWPTDQVLLLSCGVVANPTAESSNPLSFLNPLAMTPLGMPANRADALLFIESKGKASQTLVNTERTAAGTPASYRGRY